MALSQETLDYIKNYQPTDGASQESGGIGSDILWTLGLFSRPSKALWTGVDEFLKPEGSTWQGVKRGWYNEPGAKELADVVGIPEGRPEDDWAPWLGKEGARLITSALGDPATYAFAPARAAGILKSGIGIGPALLKAGVPEGKSIAGVTAKALGSDALSEAFYGLGIGKVLKSGLPKTEKYDPITRKWWEIEREGSKIPIEEQARQLQPALDKALEGSGFNYADVYHALERPDEASPALNAIADILRPMQEAKDVRFKEWNALKEGLDQEVTGGITGKGYVHMPHNVTDEQLLRLRKVGDVDLATDAFKQGGREIKRFNFNDQPLRDEAGNIIVGKASDPRTQEAIKKALSRMDLSGEAAQSGLFPEIDAMTRISPTWRDLIKESPATLRDILPIMPEGSLVENPVAALTTALTNRQGQINTLKLLDYLRGENLLWHTGKDTPAHLLQGSRQLQIPGFQNWATTPQIANWLENLAGVPTDWLGKSLQAARRTPAGQALEQGTQWFKRNVLAMAPSYWTGNLVSDTFNRYMAGQNPAELGTRFVQALNVLKNDPELLREFQIRGLPVSSWAGSMGEAAMQPSRFRGMAEGTPVLGNVADALASVSEGWSKANTAAFKYGNMATESPGRVATALDYLEKSFPGWRELPEDARARALDEAAAFAKNALVDYGSGLTATQKELHRLLIPFAGWQFGMPTLFAQQVATHPERLARVNRFLDTAFMPMSPEDLAISDEYIKENAPIKGVAGRQFPTDEKGQNQLMQLARYLPWGNIEGMVNRFPSTAWSSLNPWLKAPVEMGLNQAVYRNAPIDREATGFGDAFINPLTGGNYSKSRQEYFGQSIPAGYEYLLGQSPVGRNVNTVNDLLRSFGLWQDPYKNPVSPGSQIATLVTGGKFSPFDRAQQLKHREREYGETEKAIRSNMKYALGKGDTEGYSFYLNQLLNHVSKKSQKMGMAIPAS